MSRKGTLSQRIDIVLHQGSYWWHCNICARTSRNGYGYYGTAEQYGTTHHRDKHSS